MAFTIPTGPSGAQAPVSEAQFKAYWHDRFNSDPRMQQIRDHPRMSEQSKANSARALATDMGWIPPDTSWQIDYDKKEGIRTEQDSFFTRHQTAITAAALAAPVAGSVIAGAAGAGGAGGAAAGTGAGGAGAGAGAGGAAAGTGAGAAGTGGAAAGGSAAGGGGWLSTLGRYATGKGATDAGRIISGAASGRAAGRLTEEQIMALDANLRMNAAKTQADLYNEARRNSIRGKLMSDPPIDYASMVPGNVRAFSGTSPVDTSKNPALGKQLQDDAASVLAKGPGSYDASSIPPPPYAGKGDTALNWLGTGLELYGSIFGNGGGGGGASTAGVNPLSGAASSPADSAAGIASQQDKISAVPIQPPSLPDIPGITLPPYSSSLPMPTNASFMGPTSQLDPFLPSNVYRVNRSGVRF